MEKLSLTEANKRAEEIFDRAENGEQFLLTKYGRETAVVMSFEEYSRLLSERSQSETTSKP